MPLLSARAAPYMGRAGEAVRARTHVSEYREKLKREYGERTNQARKASPERRRYWTINMLLGSNWPASDIREAVRRLRRGGSADDGE
jgi:hypothetical protein